MPEHEELPDIPPPPATIPASPRAIARELEPHLDRILSRLDDLAIEIASSRSQIEARLDELEKKSGARHRTVINRFAKVERIIADHEARIRALETTRIVIRELNARVVKVRQKDKKGKRRAARSSKR